MLGDKLDQGVQEYVKSSRKMNGIVVVIVATEGKVNKFDREFVEG